MNMYENLSKEELIQRIKVLETDLAASVMKNAEIEKMSENLLNQHKINFLNILMNTILSNIFVVIAVKKMESVFHNYHKHKRTIILSYFYITY